MTHANRDYVRIGPGARATRPLFGAVVRLAASVVAMATGKRGHRRGSTRGRRELNARGGVAPEASPVEVLRADGTVDEEASRQLNAAAAQRVEEQQAAERDRKTKLRKKRRR